MTPRKLQKILLTDRASSTNNIDSLLTEAKKKEIKIYTIGLGSGVNTGFLKKIAEKTDGQYYFASVAENLPDIFNSIQQTEIVQLGGARNWAPTTALAFAVDAAGFEYNSNQDIITSKTDCHQANYGYTSIYDVKCTIIQANIDCEPIYFFYGDREYMIEFWKGQYGIETGGEIGVYYRYANKDLKQAEKLIGKWYKTNKDNLWDMELTVTDKKTRTNIFSMEKPHWWLTGFKWGRYTRNPGDLKTKACIKFPNSQLKNAFINGYDSNSKQYYEKAKKGSHNLQNDDHSDDGIYGLKERGYNSSSYSVKGNEVTVYFDVPKCKQPKEFKTKRVKLSQKTYEEVLAYRTIKRINSSLTQQEYNLNNPNYFDASVCVQLTIATAKSIVTSLYKNNKDCYESFDDFLRKKGKTTLADNLSNALKKNNWKNINNKELITLSKYLKKYYDKTYNMLKKSPAKMIDSLMEIAGNVVKGVFE